MLYFLKSKFQNSQQLKAMAQEHVSIMLLVNATNAIKNIIYMSRVDFEVANTAL